jgi:hypothetical protein
MSASVINPFDDDKLWNNITAENIMSKLPIDLVNKIIDFVPKPTITAKPFKAGWYCIQRVKSYSKIDNHGYGTSRFFECLVPCGVVKDMPKTMKINATKNSKGWDSYPVYESELQTINKSNLVDFEDIKRVNKTTIYYIDKPEFNALPKVIRPWRDYYEKEVLEASTNTYSHHPR